MNHCLMDKFGWDSRQISAPCERKDLPLIHSLQLQKTPSVEVSLLPERQWKAQFPREHLYKANGIKPKHKDVCR